MATIKVEIKNALKEATAIKNNEGFVASIAFLLKLLNSNELSIEDQIRVICKMIPYMEHKKSEISPDQLIEYKVKYVVDFLNHKTLTLSEKLILLPLYSDVLKKQGKDLDEIYHIVLNLIGEINTLEHVKEFVNIGYKLNDVNSMLQYNFYNDHFNKIANTMNAIPNISGYKFLIYDKYIQLLIDHDQLDKAFRICRQTEHDILFKKIEFCVTDRHIDEFDSFISVYLKSAIIGYKEKPEGLNTCLTYFLQCIMLHYCRRTISYYIQWKTNQEHVDRYQYEDRTHEYKSHLMNYRMVETAEWMKLVDDVKLKDLIPLYNHKNLDYEELIQSMENYVQNRLFKTYNDKLIWIHDLSEFAKSLIH